MKVIQTNFNQIIADSNGIQDFLWLLNREELIEIQNDFINNLLQVDCMQKESLAKNLYCIYMPHFIRDLLGLMKTYILFIRAQSNQAIIMYPDHSRFIQSFYHKNIPESPPIITELNSPPKENIFLRQRFSEIKESLKMNRISNWFDFSNSTVAVSLINNIRNHAKQSNHYVKFVHIGHWYSNQNLSNHTDWSDENRNIANQILHAVIKTIQRVDIELPEYIHQYIINTSILSLQKIYHYYHSLLSKTLPSNLWTGAGGNIWTRMLRYAVREQGKFVYGHNHGFSDGFLPDFYKHIVDFDCTNTFVTENQHQCNLLQSSIKPQWLLNHSTPHFKNLSESENKTDPFVPILFQDKNTDVKLLYPATIYVGEEVERLRYFEDYVAIDWQIRLFSQLHDWKLRVQLKLHPEERYLNPDHTIYQGIHEILPSSKPFENMLDQTDIIIFDFSHTSVLPSILRSSKPVIFIDFKFGEWDNSAYKAIQKRCYVVDGYFDEYNRAQVKWQELFNIIHPS